MTHHPTPPKERLGELFADVLFAVATVAVLLVFCVT